MNILIAVPSMDTVPAVFAQALSMLHKVGNCAIAFQVGSLIYTSRNALATRAIEMGADEIDIVVNIGAIKDGDFEYVQEVGQGN